MPAFFRTPIDREFQTASASERGVIAEIAFFVIFLGLALAALHLYAEFNFGHPHLRVGAIAVASSPAVVVYALLRLLVGMLPAFGISVGLVGLLVGINHTKLAFTGMALSWGDLATTQNMSIVLAYLSWWQIVLTVLAGAAVAVLVLIACRREQAVATMRQRIVWLGLLVLTLPVAFQPYLPNGSLKLEDKVAQFLERQGIYYLTGDWRANVSANGLFFHLVQTSRRSVPAELTELQLAMLKAIPQVAPVQNEPSHVFFILCEACWHDDTHFSNAFDPLRRLDFLPMRSVSPAYGGATVNAAFEMLTAMPSRGALRGVVYQEYGLVMAAGARTLPSALRLKGYDTYSLHNFQREFWLRHIVLPKFGFDQFIGLEDMHYDGPGPFPTDRILYAHALDILKRNQDRKAFFNLETVSSHWPYPFNNDSGEGDYGRRLEVAINDMAAFIESVRLISPNALFVVYGDHKPALTKFFFETGVLPANMFLKTGDRAEDFVFHRELDQHVLGDVPVWIGGGVRDMDVLRQVQVLSAGKPLYCISAALDVLALGSQSPAARYSLHNICDSYQANYLESADKMPAWMYSAMLFNPDRSE